MIIFPAIDLFGGSAVRLFKGDYAQMTVYNPNPVEVALDFVKCGATHIHLVDLEGAKSGLTPNISTIERIVRECNMFVEVGGGIRNMKTVEKYLGIGVDRVILGTAAVTNPDFLTEAVKKHGEHIAVGVDIKDGYVAIRGWTEKSEYTFHEFCENMQKIGVSTLICTDISRDGAMQGTNRALYRELSEKYSVNIIASGGVSTIEDITELRAMDLYGAIIGKAYYTGAIDLKEAVEVAK